MEQAERKITETLDGSLSLYIPFLDEHYHSVHGAIQESEHVFINTGLKHIEKDTINVFEVGFGTGLNALLSVLYAAKFGKQIHYFTIEKYPLNTNEYGMLNYSEMLGLPTNNDFIKLHNSKWDCDISINKHFKIRKISGDIKTYSFQNLPFFDLIYFDAFAPDKQPGLWTEDIFAGIYKHSNNKAVLTTYCAKGIVRRMLQAAGFEVERLPGPPGKREILRAVK